MGPSHLLTAALATAATASSATLSRRAPAAPRLLEAKFAGNGCGDSSGPTVSGSTSRLTFTFPDLVAQLGGDTRLRTGNCQALLSIDNGVPGFQLAVRRVSGSASFYGSPGAALTVISSAFWSNDADITFVRNSTYRPGPEGPELHSINFDFDYGDTEQALVSKCVGEDGSVGLVNINLRAALQDEGENGAVAAFVGTDEDPITEHVEFAWVACGQPPVEFETPAEGGEVDEGVVDGGEEEEEVVVDDGATEGPEVDEGVVDGGEEEEVVVDDGAAEGED